MQTRINQKAIEARELKKIMVEILVSPAAITPRTK